MRIGQAVMVGAMGALGSTAAVVRHGVKSPRSQMFGPSVYRGPGRRRSLALTFDDGPSTGTSALLDFLAEQGVRATFFVCGQNALRLPEVVRRMHREGHVVGNHTFSHARLPPRLARTARGMNVLSPGEIYDELARTQEILQRLTGVAPRLFRAPYGMRWYGLAEAQRRLGLLDVLWTSIGHDWEWPAERIAAHVLRETSPGGIVCLHDGRDVRVEVDLSGMREALRVIVPTWKANGYSLETVTDLLVPDAYALCSHTAALC